jgi:hypothetical protein
MAGGPQKAMAVLRGPMHSFSDYTPAHLLRGYFVRISGLRLGGRGR